VTYVLVLIAFLRVLTPHDFIITIAQSHTHWLRQCLLCTLCSTTMFTLCSVRSLCFPLYVSQQDKVHYFLLASTVYWLILCYHGDGHLYEIFGRIYIVCLFWSAHIDTVVSKATLGFVYRKLYRSVNTSVLTKL